MSARGRRPQPQAEAPPTEAASLVQQLLAEKRELMVACERMRLELEEIQARSGKPDPRVQRLEEENRRLRVELAAAREEKSELERGLAAAVDRLSRAST